MSRATIDQLSAGMQSLTVVGLVVAKLSIGTFEDRKNPGTSRSRFTFTLRDSESDSINCTMWGDPNLIGSAHSRFNTGDVVEVIHPQVVPKNPTQEQRWMPRTSSAYALQLNSSSDVQLYMGDLPDRQRFVRIPMLYESGFVKIQDILASPQELSQQYINVLGIVSRIGAVTSTTTSNGRATDKLEVYLTDDSGGEIRMTLWGSCIAMASNWTVRDTILFLSDVRVRTSSFVPSAARNDPTQEHERMVYTTELSFDNCSLVTEYPDLREAQELYDYAQQLPADAFTTASRMGGGMSRAAFKPIRNDEIVESQVVNVDVAGVYALRPPVFVFDVFITDLPLDDFYTQVVIARCPGCNQQLPVEHACNRPECANLGENAADNPANWQIQLPIAVTDATGTLLKIVLQGDPAMSLIGVDASELYFMSYEERSALRRRHIFQRHRVVCKMSQYRSFAQYPLYEVVRMDLF
ncbi:hypothetical protein CAOG_005505 [Capsaspora owczarzaki ATCC 30864]|uniref:Uncharacterized protein n=1 Tax=Capsaspora owczarzaki (strain ATCC 30864) TaxID=595528 RepID=A0A0D2X3V5_CAPO3|nr:hypothetical protein CAOG_005505 [Capsaspora owczarzaki ATCC 30864]